MAHASDSRLLALHGLRLKGFAETDLVAGAVGLDPSDLAPLIEQLQADDLVLRREGKLTGWSLTPTGRKEGERLLAEELDAARARDTVRSAYDRFTALNDDLLGICTDWQLRGEAVNDHADAAYDQAVIGRLIALHDLVRPVVVDLRDAMARFASYSTRLRTALERLAVGEQEWFTKPIIDSYHTVWFELHEDLLATLGLERASETKAAG